MASEKDFQLVEQLIEATKAGRVTWVPTARLDEFTASFKGKYGVIIANVGSSYTLRMVDDSEREMLRLVYDADPSFQTAADQFAAQPIAELFDLVRRTALHVDQAIDDILHELKA